MSLHAMAGVTGAILAAYLGFLAHGILAPRKPRDPHDGMAVGCLMLAGIPTIIVGTVVIAGLAFDVPALVRWPFRVCVPIATYVLLMLAAQPVVRAYRYRRRD